MSDIYLSLTETPSVVTLSQPVISSSVAATVTVGNTVTVALDANSLSALENVTVTVGAAVSVSNFPSTQVVTGSVAVTTMPAISISSVTISNFPATQVVSVSNLPASHTVVGTVTANIFGLDQDLGTYNQIPVIGFDTGIEAANLGNVVPVQISNTSGVIGQGNPLPISGTVTANVAGNLNSTLEYDGSTFFVKVAGRSAGGKTDYPINISGTVTANNPSGALTTRFGSVTTANTAQLTSAVTNTSRKYLLVQNIATSTVTIGIGFAPTTTQGIQLTAGAGLTFDAFCPTGGVWWLSSTTGSNFSILEG